MFTKNKQLSKLVHYLAHIERVCLHLNS